jgi:hypothetical protein
MAPSPAIERIQEERDTSDATTAIFVISHGFNPSLPNQAIERTKLIMKKADSIAPPIRWLTGIAYMDNTAIP